MQMQTQVFSQQNQEQSPLPQDCTLATSAPLTDARQVKVQDVHYNTNLWEYPTYCKDWRD